MVCDFRSIKSVKSERFIIRCVFFSHLPLFVYWSLRKTFTRKPKETGTNGCGSRVPWPLSIDSYLFSSYLPYTMIGQLVHVPANLIFPKTLHRLLLGLVVRHRQVTTSQYNSWVREPSLQRPPASKSSLLGLVRTSDERRPQHQQTQINSYLHAVQCGRVCLLYCRSKRRAPPLRPLKVGVRICLCSQGSR